MSKIKKIFAREIIDSRGYPTIESEVYLEDGSFGKSSVPSGASTGSKEALELRDNDKKYFFGNGVLTAVKNVNNIISKILKNKNAKEQEKIDEIMIKEDGTKNKSNLGSNSILSVSLAIAKAYSKYKKINLYEYIYKLSDQKEKIIVPRPMINIINGGKHSNNNLDIQEFMIQPSKNISIKKSIRMGCEVFHSLYNILKKNNISVSVGDEGGFAPNLKNNEESFKLIEKSIKNTKYKLGKDINIAIDCAGSELYNKFTKKYEIKSEKKFLNYKEFTKYLKKMSEKYFIKSIEDGLEENDWKGFIYQTKKIGNDIQIVGDDLFVTNPLILKKGILKKAANAILIKLNQIGTLTETLKTINLAKKHKYNTIISHRSGETEDTFISDLSIGTISGQIKTGSMSRSERTCKYNRLIRIEEQLIKQNYKIKI
ncbi:phosphopyruvate hydratase [Buchnera aphidicola (Ceratovacuna keduensis)]|uniref:phosphopyruvate hydratase n=1 Tax=Buchnera aphidicola TaxID=9 RepID=UPI0031B8A55A